MSSTDQWTTRPLWSMFRRVKDVGHPDEEMLSVFRDHGVVAKSSMPNLNQTAENRDIYQLVQPGWLIINRMKAWQGSVGISGLRGIVSGHYICFEPRHHENPSYLNWLLRSPVFAHEFRRLSRGVRPSQQEIDNEQLRLMPITVPSKSKQDEIVRYLDRETARIDGLIGQQEHLIANIHERLDASWGAVLGQLTGAPQVRVRRLVESMVDGPFGSALTSAHYFDSGVRVVRLGNIGVFEFRSTDAVFISTDYAASLQGHAVLQGDVVIAGLGDDRMPLGRATVVPDIGPAIVKADCFRVRVNQLVTADFLAWALSSPPVRSQIALLARGSTRPRLNLSTASEVVIPLPALEVQRRVVAAHRRDKAANDLLVAESTILITLLQERRVALITAAVTGQIDVRSEVDTLDAGPSHRFSSAP